MDSAKLNDWMQVFGIFAVVGSLIFVGMQMKQDRDIALSAAMQARTDTTVQDILAKASNPIYLSAIEKIELGDMESLLPSEKLAVSIHNAATLFNLENVHSQYLSGYVSEDRWRAPRAAIKGLLRSTYDPRKNYEANPAAWRESFQQLLDELINEIDSETAGKH